MSDDDAGRQALKNLRDLPEYLDAILDRPEDADQTLLDSWDGLGAEQQAEILGLLGPLRDGVDSETVLHDIEEAIFTHAFAHALSGGIPIMTKKTIERLASKVEEAARLMREANVDMQELLLGLVFWPSEVVKPSYLRDPLAGGLTTRLGDIAEKNEVAARDLRSWWESLPVPRPGPAVRPADQGLALEMGRLWEEVTGRRATRQNRDGGRKFTDDGPFLAFLEAVMRAAAGPQDKPGSARLARFVAQQLARGRNPSRNS